MNDVPLVKDNKINDINTSIIAIKKQLKQLNEAVGLIDIPDMPDLSPYIKKSDIVDIVASGDMHPVTSNAVANSLSGKLDTRIYSDVDLNTILDFGMYRIQCPSGNYDALHFPPMQGRGTLIVARPATFDTNLTQVFILDWSPVIYIRYINLATNTFHSWKSLNSKQEKGQVTTNENVTRGNIYWLRKGNVTTIYFEDVAFASWGDGDRNISTSKVPIPIPMISSVPIFSIEPLNGASPSQALQVTSDGYLRLNGGSSQIGTFYDSFTYICED